MAYITFSEEIDVSAYEWFDEANNSDRAEMWDLCKEWAKDRIAQAEPKPTSIMEEAFMDKLNELHFRYYSLPQETIDKIMNL